MIGHKEAKGVARHVEELAPDGALALSNSFTETTKRRSFFQPRSWMVNSLTPRVRQALLENCFRARHAGNHGTTEHSETDHHTTEEG